MTLRFFEGPAGSGKTTSLINELGAVLRAQPLEEHQRVLALTRMHGSRRRLDARLKTVPGLRRFECSTFDRFAWRLLGRFRQLARLLAGGASIDELGFAAASALTGRMLEERFVRSWVAATYPIVVVDELQDSKDGQLSMLRALESVTTCLAAADAFQDLDGDAQNEPVEWARSRCAPTVLDQVHRTRVAGLLAAALALREGRALAREPERGFRIVTHPAPLAAWQVAMQLKRWGRHREIAVISPASAEASSYVRTILERVAKEPLGKKVRVGPYRIAWEDDRDTAAEALIAALGLPEDRSAIVTVESLRAAGCGRTHGTLLRWAERRRSLTGDAMFVVGEVRDQIYTILQHERAHCAVATRRLTAMSVHAAKNREFDAVIVLWPHQAPAQQDRARRLLYNAITRARTEALVIVPSEARLALPPFIEWRPDAPPRPIRARRLVEAPTQPEDPQQLLWS